MNVVPSKARRLARRLRRENRKGRPWRKIAAEDYQNKVHYATLNRIAKTKGTWLPRDEATLIILGLNRSRRKRIADMSPRELLWRLVHREEMK